MRPLLIDYFGLSHVKNNPSFRLFILIFAQMFTAALKWWFEEEFFHLTYKYRWYEIWMRNSNFEFFDLSLLQIRFVLQLWVIPLLMQEVNKARFCRIYLLCFIWVVKLHRFSVCVNIVKYVKEWYCKVSTTTVPKLIAATRSSLDFQCPR